MKKEIQNYQTKLETPEQRIESLTNLASRMGIKKNKNFQIIGINVVSKDTVEFATEYTFTHPDGNIDKVQSSISVIYPLIKGEEIRKVISSDTITINAKHSDGSTTTGINVLKVLE